MTNSPITTRMKMETIISSITICYRFVFSDWCYSRLNWTDLYWHTDFIGRYHEIVYGLKYNVPDSTASQYPKV